MKRRIYIAALLTIALLASTAAEAQLRSAYFMNGSTQRYELNPALSPNRGYFALPVVGDSYANIETNFLSAENFFFPNGEGNGVVTYMHKSVTAEQFLNRLPDMNNMELGLNSNILSIGNYFSGGFWSLGLRLRSETNIDIPKDFFALTKTLSKGSYNISNMGIETSNFVETSLGYTFPVQDVFTLGFRAKVLLGLANISAKIDRLDIEIGEESYRADLAGTFESNIAGYNFQDMTGEVTMEKFVNHLTDINNFDPSLIRSVGVAFDAGIEWTFRDEQIRLSAAINDLGFNAWNAQNSFCATVDNVTFAFNGYDFENNEVAIENPENIVLRTTSETTEGRRALHSSLVVGLEYNLLNDLVGLGALWNKKFYDNRTWNSIGASVTLRPTPSLSLSASYSVVNSVGVAGAAINLHSSLVNIFVGADYFTFKYGTANGGAIPIPLSQNSVNLAFGVTIPLKAKMF